MSGSPGPAIGPSRKKPFGTVAAGLLLAHLVLVMVGVVGHEPWFDEAQSWLLARDAGVGELLGAQLRLEGHPPLWYLLLAVPAKLGLPYGSGNVLSAVCAVLGVLLFLVLPSVPGSVRLLVPFGFFVVYQYAVVARSYALFLPLLMVLAHLYPHRRRRVVAFAVILVVMATVSLHGLALAWAFAALYALEVWSSPRPLGAAERRCHLVACGVLVAGTVFLLAVLWPPPDILRAAALTPRSVLARLAEVSRLSVLGLFPGPPALGALFFAGFLLWFWRQRLALTFGLLFAAVFAINGLYSSRWHEGLFYLVWLFVLILSFRRPAPPLQRGLATAMAVMVLVLHAWWGARTLAYDALEPYSAATTTAAYLRANKLDERQVYGIGFSTLALEPYFPAGLLDNYRPPSGHRYWDWSLDEPMFRPGSGLPPEAMAPLLDAVLRQGPEILVVGLKFRTDAYAMERLGADPRYRPLRQFGGGLYWKNQRVEPESFAVFARVDGGS